jgi:hypothetical protein
MKWVTREKVKVDRVACPWLIKRFIDPDAEFVEALGRSCVNLRRRRPRFGIVTTRSWMGWSGSQTMSQHA